MCDESLEWLGGFGPIMKFLHVFGRSWWGDGEVKWAIVRTGKGFTLNRAVRDDVAIGTAGATARDVVGGGGGGRCAIGDADELGGGAAFDPELMARNWRLECRLKHWRVENIY